MPVEIPKYIAGRRQGPPAIVTLEIEAQSDIEMVQKENLIWALTRLSDISNQVVSSWTGFNQQTRNCVAVTKDVIGYLLTINAPSTSLYTAHQVLVQAKEIIQQLHLESILCVFHQALY